MRSRPQAQKEITTGPSVSVLLIDDQAIIGEAVRKALQGQRELEFHHCMDPTKALEMAAEVKPTVILLDLVMPQVHGLILLRYFRANPDTSDVPIVVLSTKEDPRTKAEAFSLGANDYLVKLPAKEEIVARVRYHSRGYISLLQRNEAYRQLAESQRALEKELSTAAEYVQSMLPAPLEGVVESSWLFLPSIQLGGDTFGYHWLDSDHLAMYLLDVCGHGVGSALLSVSVMNVMRSRSLPNRDFFDPKDVLTGLNETFPMENHDNRFFTMWYGVYDKRTRKLTYSSGGHPPALLFNEPGAEPKQLATEGFIIGGMPGVAFERDTVEISEGAKLFVYSDGIFELQKPSGEMLSFGEFLEVFKEPSDPDKSDLERLLERTREIQDREMFDDDYSIVEFRFP